MFVAYSLDRTRRFALPGASPLEADGAVQVSPSEARDLTSTLCCADPHCEAALVYRQGEVRRPHWGHAPGTAGCAESGGEGDWHRWVCRDLFGRALAHEFVMPGARADVVVARRDAQRRIAIEVQHSPIARAMVEARHRAHEAAGVVATQWVLNADGADWGGVVRVSWVVDLVDACMNSGTYPTQVAVLSETGLRYVDRCRLVDDDLGRGVQVTSWTDEVPVHVVRDWAASPEHRRLSQADDPTVTLLDCSPTRRVKPTIAVAKVAPDGSRLRVMFDRADYGLRTAGEALGLTWRAGPQSYSDGSEAVAGRLVGPCTPEVLAWLAVTGTRQLAA